MPSVILKQVDPCFIFNAQTWKSDRHAKLLSIRELSRTLL